MKVVYKTSTSAEARMILDMLERADISGRIDGEYLAGGVGELQAINFIRVLVAEQNYDAARNIIDQWESAQILNEPNDRKLTKKGRFSFSSAFLGMALGGIIVATFYNTPITTEGVDYNNDGILDEKWTYLDDRVSKYEVDRNLDGKVDLIYEYGIKGILISSISDDDFNGTFESEVLFYKGNPLELKIDTDNDKKVDYHGEYQNGVFIKATFIDTSTEKPTKIQHYHLEKVITAELDTDNDGVMDLFYKYDANEEIIERSTQPFQ